MATFTDDMSTPVTRGELRDELQQFKVGLEQLEQQLEQKLEMWGGALLAHIESNERRFAQQLASSEQRLIAELARHTRAIQESMSTQISVVDEKYHDLPARVRQLEATVFPPERR